jgi:hypothetical protein
MLDSSIGFCQNGGTWISWPLGNSMEQINSSIFFQLGKWLELCYVWAKLPIKNYNIGADNAKSMLESLIGGKVNYKLDESLPAAKKLIASIDTILATYAKDAEASASEPDSQSYISAFFEFDNALSLELGRSPIFYVTPKGVFDTRRLIVDGAAVFDGYRERIPDDAINDANQSGRCLVFDLPTAAGFHIARATESVIRKQMLVFGCPCVKDSQRNWGSYIKSLKEKGANKKVLHHLEQLKDLHRNPLIHPEVTLTIPEALSLWSMCASAIQSMVADMETKSETPSAEIIAMIPAPDSE